MDPTDASPDLAVEDRFAIVTEWLLDADIGDAAVRLYAVLLGRQRIATDAAEAALAWIRSDSTQADMLLPLGVLHHACLR